MDRTKSENKMCIYDLDGTLDLTDSKLSVEICHLSKMGVDFVTATGRTNSYVMETCNKYGIIPPRYIIADNGGTIYDNRKKEYLKRTTLPLDTRIKVLEAYINLGGSLEEIRYTDGDNVYVAESADVRKYYEEENTIEYRTGEELLETLYGEESDITKITLAGNKKMMKQLSEVIEESGIRCRTDIGSTKFPLRAKQNYRLDIMDGETCKGEAIEFLVDYTGIKDFMCIGNGPNDFSMFKYALDSNMPIIVVKNFEDGKESKESEEVIRRVEEYAKQIGKEENVTVARFPINGYIGRVEEKKNARQKRQQFADGIKVRETPKIDSSKKGEQDRIRRIQERGEK